MIKGLQKVSLIDYPGKICSVVFLTKCNLRCSYCYNPELVLDDKKLKEIPEKEFFNFLKTRKNLIDAVCITGGEPTLYKELPKLIKKIKTLGFLVKLDTNGTNPKMLNQLIKNGLIDFVAMDIKNTFKEYENTVKSKINCEDIKESISIITKSRINHEFRTTVLPSIHKKESLVNIAKEQLKGAKKYVLQQFFSTEKMLDKRLQKERKYSKEELENIRDECNKYLRTEIRNL